jgi:hypothetical protein
MDAKHKDRKLAELIYFRTWRQDTPPRVAKDDKETRWWRSRASQYRATQGPAG